MTYVDDLLIVGEKLAQESFLAKLSAMFPLKHQTKLDAQTPLTFLGKLVEYNQQEHSISLHLPTAYYQKLFKLYGMEQAKPASTTGDKLGRNDDPADPLNQLLDPARHKLYRTAVGKLLWATPVRPDISFAVKELSRSLQSPTQQNEKELKHVLRYLKGSLQYTTCLKPPRKRVVEQASTIEIQAFADSDWAGCAKTRKSTSGASLALWGVTIATSSRTQATQALSSAEAELYAMGMAIQDALHLQSLLQELKLTQLAKPFELTVYTDSSSGKALASKLGLTRKSKHVQLRFLFMQDLVATGQLKLSRVPSEKNPADVLTKYLQASTLHKLLPKLGVVTRAVDSKDLLSMVSFGGQVSSGPLTSSFFIGMLAESHASAQLVASRAYSRQSLPGSLRLERQEDQPAAPSTPTSFSWSRFVCFSVCIAALLGLPFFFGNFDFKLYGALLSSMMIAVQLVLRVSFLLQQVAFRTRAAASAFRTLSSVAWGSLRTTKSLNRILLVSFLLAQLALLVQKRSLIMSASFAQNESFESFNSLQPSFCFGSLCFSPASALKMSLSSAASAASVLGAPPGASAAAASSFSHEETVMMQLQNEAFALPEALLDHTLQAQLCNKNGEAYPKQLPAEIFKLAVPKLEKKKLRFWLLLHEEAFKSFKEGGFKQLPQQRCSGTNNANLGNFQASSSFSKQVAFTPGSSTGTRSLQAKKLTWSAWTSCRKALCGQRTSCSLRRRSRLTTELRIPSFASGGSLIQQKASQALSSLALKWAAWSGSLETSQSFPSTFTAQQASTGAQLPASGSLQRTGGKIACSTPRCTGSFKRTLAQLLLWESLSELTLQKLGKSQRQLHHHQLQPWQLLPLQLSGRMKPSLRMSIFKRRFPR